MPTVKKVLICMIVLQIYLVIGAFLFKFLEFEAEKERWEYVMDIYSNISKFGCNRQTVNDLMANLDGRHYYRYLISNDTDTVDAVGWNFFGSLFFSLVVVSTVGFGNQVPNTLAGQIVCVFYALIGIPMFMVTCNAIVKITKVGIDKIKTKLPKSLKPYHSAIPPITLSILFIIIFIVPTQMIATHEDWTYGTAMYFEFIALTTIGFGDYVPGNSPFHQNYYKIFLFVWMSTGLILVSTIIGYSQYILETLSTNRTNKRIRSVVVRKTELKSADFKQEFGDKNSFNLFKKNMNRSKSVPPLQPVLY